MSTSVEKSHVPEFIVNFPIDNGYYPGARLHTVKRKSTAGKLRAGQKRVVFIASPADQKVIDAVREKYNIRAVSEVARMALKRLAETENLNCA